ncbi:universal stress protein [Mucilaginibacter sp. R-33]|uniref:universal stress protein n=1 Tax=Mucilaginibacter sp. R-33 TaxID=3416711 RepID=UPI003CEFE9F8
MKTIIAATDYSPAAENAVTYAAALAKHFNYRLLLFNAFSLSLHESNTLLPASTVSELEAKNQDRLAQQAAITALIHDITVSCETSYTPVTDELQNLVKKHNASLVVLGMAPESQDQWVLGNTTTTAIKNLAFPVLVVPIGARFKGLKKIMLACDVANDQPVQLLSMIRNEVIAFESPVEIFYVNKEAAEIKPVQDTVAHNFQAAGIDCVYRETNSTKIVAELKKELINCGAELLIMIPKKHGFWSSLLHRSKTRQMATGLNIPLLAVPMSS